jgi:hypothetical protein
MDQLIVPRSDSKVTHLDADNLNGLVPSGQSTTNGRRGNLLQRAQLVILGFALSFPNA